MKLPVILSIFGAVGALAAGAGGSDESLLPSGPTRQLKVRVTWGLRSPSARDFFLKPLAKDLKIEAAAPFAFEAGDTFTDQECRTTAGGGDVDGLELTLVFAERDIAEIKNVQQIWRYLLDHADAETVRRLKSDPGYRPDTRKLTIQMNAEGTSGFSLTVDQLLRERNFWLPELDVFISANDPPTSLNEHLGSIEKWRGERVLDEVNSAPEASYEQFTARWENMGSPSYQNPHSVRPGHIVGLTWDSALAKFGIDRGGNVWNDYGNADRFHLGFDFGALNDDLKRSWKGQHLVEGLPILTTQIERDGVRYELEQFAYPLNGPPPERQGDIPMVLLEKVRLTDLSGRPQSARLRLTHRREIQQADVSVGRSGSQWVWSETANGRLWLMLEGAGVALETNVVDRGAWTTNEAGFSISLPPHGSRELILKLPSAPLGTNEKGKLSRLKFQAARGKTERYWSDYLAKSALFDVPDEAVNTLFRANLWHALRLPRRHGSSGPDVKLDLPYSNFAYDQKGTPWPVNQAVYVDYMLYDLRGLHRIAAEELAAMYRNNQEANGHVGGFANWGVYTPGMIYAVAKHFLLEGDRASFEALLPQTLKALDWCLAESRAGAERVGPAQGLVLWPLNDLSHDSKAWAFNQAYLYAGVETLGQALAETGHPRARECRLAAKAIHDAVQAAFGRASMLSPLVQLRDHTWIPYVPSDALVEGRLFDVWYPTDVDTGSLHLSRLNALAPRGRLTDYLLLDHEDNLFFKHWGMANEPVYNQQATAYLARDNPKAVIRAFYSMMACAFSHSAFEPVEHRWGWGQYFGPPSTDGAWFELYRRMLIEEREDGSLLLCQATPRRWLENGKRIRVERAPTYFGPIEFIIQSQSAKGEIRATVEAPRRKAPSTLLVRLRHPDQKPLRSVTVNGRRWMDFDAAQEWVRIPNPRAQRYTIVAHYEYDRAGASK